MNLTYSSFIDYLSNSNMFVFDKSAAGEVFYKFYFNNLVKFYHKTKDSTQYDSIDELIRKFEIGF